MEHELRSSFYDPAGAPMDAVEFRKTYPARTHIAMTPLFGVVIVTDFVGINHRAGKGTPKIYETWVAVLVRAGRVTVSSSWTGGMKRSVAIHACVVLAAACGGFAWWRFKAWRLTRG